MNGYQGLARLMRALAHPTRLQILEVLEEEGEACVCHLERRLGQRQAYISQQLSRLREAGLVVDQREGLNIFYSLAGGDAKSLLEEAKALVQILAEKEEKRVHFPVIRKIPPERCNCPKCEEKVRMSISLESAPLSING